MSFLLKDIKYFLIFPLNIISFSFDIYIRMHVEFIFVHLVRKGPNFIFHLDSQLTAALYPH